MATWLAVTLILMGVVLLAALRAWTWVRKERLLREAGLISRPADPTDSGPGRSER